MIWGGTNGKKMTGYTCGSLHAYYEQMGTIRVKEDEPFPEIRNKLIKRFAGEINP